VFAKLKALLRQAAARTKEALWTTIGELLDRFPAEECQNSRSSLIRQNRGNPRVHLPP
jgi:hypothetical protein